MRPAAADPLIWTPAIVAGVLASLSLYLSQWGTYMKFVDRVGTYWDQNGDSFDFIIIGGGSAGGVVASRLSQYYKVLLLEAGGRINPMQTIPAMSLLMLNYPEIDWKHKTVPQKNSCFSLPQNKSHWSQGKGLGGTSNLNFLIQSRGHPNDFDNWANLTGDPSWSYDNLLPYFKKTEDFHGIWKNDHTHGTGGPVRVALPEYVGMGDIYVQAAEDLGYPRQDLNGFYTEGFDTIYYPIKNGRRYGVFPAFIEEASQSPEKTITIRQFAHVKKILIDGNKRAYGVEYDWHGKTSFAYAGKEVIMSAGAMTSPQLLMLSGIGPRAHLERLGIEVRSDLPVGQNLQDHMSVYLGPFFVDKPITFSIEHDITSISVANFFTAGRGILTTSGAQAMGFFVSEAAKRRGQPDWPDIQLFLIGVSVGGDTFARDFARGFGVKTRVLERYWAHASDKDSFLQVVSLGRPNARGSITLRNSDPYTPALIDPNYFDNQEDLDIIVEGMKKAVDIVEKTKTFAKVNGHFTDIPFPGCENIPFRSDAYWRCYATHFSVTLHHIVGSCSFGKDRKKAVVDTKLRVFGIDGLRVIDASVMPVVVAGNTNAPTIMIGEKGAQMILDDYEEERLEAIRLAEEERIQREKEAQLQAAAAAAAAAVQAAQAASTTTTTVKPPDGEDPDDYDYDIQGVKHRNVKEEDGKKLAVEEQEKLFINSYYRANKEIFEKAAQNFTRVIKIIY